MEVLAKLLKFLNSDIISGVLTAKDVVGTVQEVIDHFKTGNTGLETQVYTLLDYSISEFAKEFRLEYDDKWLWKILGCKEDILKEVDKTLQDETILKYVFNKNVSQDEVDEWRRLNSGWQFSFSFK